MPTTPKGLRIPAGNFSPNVPQDITNLANDVDARLLIPSAAAIPTLSGWNNLGGGFAVLQGYQLGTLAVIHGVITNVNTYGAQVTASNAIPVGLRPARAVIVHGGVQTAEGLAIQSCRFDILPSGSLLVTPPEGVAVLAGRFHSLMAVYNTNNV